MKFVKLFKTELERFGFKTVAQMAERAGMNQVYLGQIFNGKRPPPSDEVITEACAKLGLSKQKTMQLLLAAAIDKSQGRAAKLWEEIEEATDKLDGFEPCRRPHHYSVSAVLENCGCQ